MHPVLTQLIITPAEGVFYTYSVSKTQSGHRYSSAGRYTVVTGTTGICSRQHMYPGNLYIHVWPKCHVNLDYSTLMEEGTFFLPNIGKYITILKYDNGNLVLDSPAI